MEPTIHEIDDFYLDVKGFVTRRLGGAEQAEAHFQKYPSFLARLWFKAESGLRAGTPAAQVAFDAISAKTSPAKTSQVHASRAARARMWNSSRLQVAQ